MVGQALIGLEKAGLIERELDVDRNRCHAIRLVPAGESPAPKRKPPRREHHHVLGPGLEYGDLLGQSRGRTDVPGETAAHAEIQVRAATAHVRAERDRLRRQLEKAELELGAAIRRGVELSRRIQDLESKLQAALSLAARSPSRRRPAASGAAGKLLDEPISSR